MGLLEIEGLTHSFGENLLYKNAKFSLNRGEHIGVVGQNGTGKSTLIKICTEQIMPDAGRDILSGSRIYLLDTSINMQR